MKVNKKVLQQKQKLDIQNSIIEISNNIRLQQTLMSSVSSSKMEGQQSIKLEKHQLHMLASDSNKFMSILSNLRMLARAKMDRQMIEEALIYLDQAEKILEYAASCGKNIDRLLIIEVLHNQAYCYQKNWELDKCSIYLKAIIFNIESKDPQHSPSCIRSNITIGSGSFLHGKSSSPWSWRQRMQLAQYKIQLCAIQSQLGHHNISIESAQNAVKLIKSIMSEMDSTRKRHFKNIKNIKNGSDYFLNQPFQHFHTKFKIIQGLSSIDDIILVDHLDSYLKAAEYYLNCWRMKKKNKGLITNATSIQQLSISKFTHMQPLSQQDIFDRKSQYQIWYRQYHNQVTQKQIFLLQSFQSILKIVALLSITYFSIGTQLRIMTLKKYKYSSALSNQSNQLKYSQIYTLQSIIILCIYFPFQIILIQHLVSNYNAHYNEKLNYISNNLKQIQLIKNKFDKSNFCSKYQNKERHNQINQMQKTLIVSASSLQGKKMDKTSSKQKLRKLKKNTQTTGSKSTINSKKSKSSSKIIDQFISPQKPSLKHCRSQLFKPLENKKLRKNKSQEKKEKQKIKFKQPIKLKNCNHHPRNLSISPKKDKNVKVKNKKNSKQKPKNNEKVAKNIIRKFKNPEQYSEYFQTEQANAKNHLNNLIYNLHKKYKQQVSSNPLFKQTH